MKIKKIFKILILLLVLSCKKTDNQYDGSWMKISEKLKYQEKKEHIYLESGRFRYKLSKENTPFQKIIVLNTTLLGYILELEQEHKIVGVAGAQYIYSEKIRNYLQSGLIKDVGNENKYDVEKILALKPDVIFTNYIATFENTYHILRKNGIEIIFLDEYLENNPLEKAAYLKLLGKLLGVEKKANQVYTEIESNYYRLKEKVKGSDRKPKVLIGEMYGNHWFMAGGKTFVAHYLRDAGSDYILKDNQEERPISMSFEEVFTKSNKMEIWTNVGNYHTKKQLLAINPAYGKLEVFQKGKIYNITKRQKGVANDFFESGSVRVDRVLGDYIKIFHPYLMPKDTLIYMQEVK